MNSTLRRLAQDTAVYGMSSMLGRLLTWLLNYVYARVLIPEEMGQMTHLYAWTGLLLIVLTYGMETSFFRFVSTHERPPLVFSTTLCSLGVSSLSFVLLGCIFLPHISEFLQLPHGGESLVLMLLFIVASDAFLSIPLGYLRYQRRPWLFVGVRLGFVFLTIALTLIAFYMLPIWARKYEWLVYIYSPTYHLHYILGINLIGNICQSLLLLPTIRQARGGCDLGLLRQMLSYSWPILLLGLVGSLSSLADKIIFPTLFSDRSIGNAQLGIYGACYKLAMIMLLFTQAFRYAYDPFVFAKSKEGEAIAKQAYADAMKYYYLFSLIILLGVITYLDILKHFITPQYFEGLKIVPYVLVGQLMFGIYANSSVWFKLTDRTIWGAILSLIGCAIMIGIMIWLTPTHGYMACAYAIVASNGTMMLLSYFLGQRYYRIAYDLKRMGGFGILALSILAVEYWAKAQWPEMIALRIGIGSLMLLLFVGLIWRIELSQINPLTLLKKLKK